MLGSVRLRAAFHLSHGLPEHLMSKTDSGQHGFFSKKGEWPVHPLILPGANIHGDGGFKTW